nr:MAG TPA: lysozyme [Caudoviricetes sp.]
MLFNYPSFIGEKEQSESELLYNNVRMEIQTHIGEIWVDLELGTNIRNLIKSGIDNITVAEIRTELETKLDKYFHNDLTIETLDIWQELDKLKINLEYIELRTGTHYTVQSEETIINKDQTLYYNNETM